MVNNPFDINGLIFNSPVAVSYLSMDTQTRGILNQDTAQVFQPRHLYTIGGVNIVLKQYYPKAALKPKSGKAGKNASPTDVMLVKVDVDEDSKELFIEGGKNYTSASTKFSFGGLNFNLNYGAKNIQLPFSIELVDFQLDRYPGSMSPASYASEVILIDERHNINEIPHPFLLGPQLILLLPRDPKLLLARTLIFSLTIPPRKLNPGSRLSLR